MIKKKFIGSILIILSFVGLIIVIKGYIYDHIKKVSEKRTKLFISENFKNLQQSLYKIKFQKYNNIPLEKLQRLDFIDQSLLDSGRLEMKNHKAIVVGIARDNITDLPIMIRNIEYIGSFFSDYRVVIFENDSYDGTKEALHFWSENNKKVKLISEDFGNTKRPSIKFLSDVRNKYIDAIKAAEYDDFDIVMAVDMDMTYGFDIRGIFDSFAKKDRWDFVCSNGIFTEKGKMWDMFAFRNEEFPYGPNDIFSSIYWSVTVSQGQKIYDPKDDLVEVNSCFGGLAFYKRKFMNNCRYDSIDQDCEHVVFHRCIKDNGARMYMNPAQILRYSHYRK